MMPVLPARGKFSVALAMAGLLLAACGRQDDRPVRPIIGDAGQGAIEISRSGCGSCHEIPGVEHAIGLVGPPLSHFSRRTIIAGLLPNNPPNLVHWLQYPQAVVPGNAMPDGGLDDRQARDIAAYLYTLR